MHQSPQSTAIQRSQRFIDHSAFIVYSSRQEKLFSLAIDRYALQSSDVLVGYPAQRQRASHGPSRLHAHNSIEGVQDPVTAWMVARRTFPHVI